jgi:hypothetical protein
MLICANLIFTPVQRLGHGIFEKGSRRSCMSTGALNVCHRRRLGLARWELIISAFASESLVLPRTAPHSVSRMKLQQLPRLEPASPFADTSTSPALKTMRSLLDFQAATCHVSNHQPRRAAESDTMLQGSLEPNPHAPILRLTISTLSSASRLVPMSFPLTGTCRLRQRGTFGRRKGAWILTSLISATRPCGMTGRT